MVDGEERISDRFAASAWTSVNFVGALYDLSMSFFRKNADDERYLPL